MDMDMEEEMVYRLVFPDQADVDKGYISILAPLGTALLGYSVGDIIEWSVLGHGEMESHQDYLPA